jgi:hypothetical protein
MFAQPRKFGRVSLRGTGKRCSNDPMMVLMMVEVEFSDCITVDELGLGESTSAPFPPNIHE